MDLSERRALALDLSIAPGEEGGARRLTILDSALLFRFRAAIVYWSRNWRGLRRISEEIAPQAAFHAPVV